MDLGQVPRVRPMSGWPDGEGRDPVSLPDPLPPEWSERHGRSPIRVYPPEALKISNAQDIDVAIQTVAGLHCPEGHVMASHIRGGEPLSVERCMACGAIDWEGLRKQADAYARLYAARLLEEVYGSFEYPDGSRRIAWVEGKAQMVNIQQVYNLFTKQEQDGSN
jgi:hypothetical protein